MFSIRELSKVTGISSQTIRYYERIMLLPKAQRMPNGYRIYNKGDLARLQFVKQARLLNFTLEEIREILDLRELHQAPCSYVMSTMASQIKAIEEQIADLQNLKIELTALYEIGLTMPEDVEMKTCVCHLIHQRRKEEEI
jgi:DNA-binding transcriptional MerR regulator